MAKTLINGLVLNRKKHSFTPKGEETAITYYQALIFDTVENALFVYRSSEVEDFKSILPGQPVAELEATVDKPTTVDAVLVRSGARSNGEDF